LAFIYFNEYTAYFNEYTAAQPVLYFIFQEYMSYYVCSWVQAAILSTAIATNEFKEFYWLSHNFFPAVFRLAGNFSAQQVTVAA